MSTPTTPNPNSRPEMDDLLNEIRNELADPAVVRAAAARVWSRIENETNSASANHVIRGCSDFLAMLPDYRTGTLAESRRVLLEDHLHECVACRRAAETGKVLQFPKLGQAPVVRPSVWRVPQVRYAAAAAVFLIVGFASWGVLKNILSLGPRFIGSPSTVQIADGQIFRLAGQTLVPMQAGERIPEGAEVRTGRNSHAVVSLKDGSRVEMKERTAFSVTESPRDLNVQLARGAVIVEAAHRSAGHLYVTTRDCRVAVTGTVFSVDSGVKGSRVSVIEGEVHVDQDSTDTVLHPGDQKTTDSSMEPTSIANVISWSANAPRHEALLKEMVALRGELAKIQQPGMRYSSRMLARVPSNTVFYMAIPNIGTQLGQAQEVMSRRVQESPVLQEWWQEQSRGAAFTKVLDTVRNFSNYLGDEVVVAAAMGRDAQGKPKFYAPVLMAELKQGGFKEFAASQFAQWSRDGKGTLSIVDDPATASNTNGHLLMAVSTDMVAVSPDAESMRMIAPTMQTSSPVAASSSPFLDRVHQSYQEGVGFLMAADLGALASSIRSVGNDGAGPAAALGNVQYMLVEQRDGGSATDTRATMTFNGARQGIFGWLAKPAAIGALDYVTADASLATGFAINNPGQVIDDILAWAGANNPNFNTDLSQTEAELGFSIRNDLAASLGSEFVLSLDGPVLPPSWKIVTEVYDQSKLQFVIGQLINDANAKLAKNGKAPLQASQQTQNGLTYYQVTWPEAQGMTEIDYVFNGGYLIAAPSRVLLDQAIAAKTSGTSLPRSASFRAALPHDGRSNFSAVAYENLGSMGATLSDTLSALGKQRGAKRGENVQALIEPNKPGLVGAYGEDDRIVVSSTALPGFGSGTLMNMAGPVSLFNLFGAKAANKSERRGTNTP